MTSRPSTVLLVATLILLLSACRAGRSMNSPFQGSRGGGEVTLHVINLAFSDATLYSVATGSRTKLGVVTGKQEDTFRWSLEFPTDMHVEIRLLAGPTCSTEQMTIDPGDILELIIQHEGADLRCRASAPSG